MSAPAATRPLTCMRCSRVATDPEAKGWLAEPELIVQGVRIGVCHFCRTGETPPAEDDSKQCDGSCKGDYRPVTGIYFEAIWGDYGVQEKWACWDEACVEEWADEQDDSCFLCGHSVDVRIVKYENGKRVRS